MKKKILLMLAIVMMLGVVGCSDKESKEEVESTQAPNNENTQAPTTNDDKDNEDGKDIRTLADIFEQEYTFSSYLRTSDGYCIYVIANEIAPDMAKLADNIEGKTVAELREEYDISIAFSRFGNDYELSTTIGTITYEFEIENGPATLEENKEDSFYDLEEDEAVQDDELKNVKVVEVSYKITLDAESEEFLNTDREKVDMDYIRDNADKLIVKEFEYELE